MKRTAALLLGLSLAACAGEGAWTKDGTSREQAARDYAECRSLAQSAMQRDTDIDQDIMATRGGDWQRTGVMTAHRATYAARNESQSADIVTRCMVGKGYAPAG
jgi:hypothetical protein